MALCIGTVADAIREPRREHHDEQLRIVVGCDDAGLQYKDILQGDLQADPRVADVDVGVGPDEHTAYPHVAVAAAA